MRGRYHHTGIPVSCDGTGSWIPTSRDVGGMACQDVTGARALNVVTVMSPI